MKRILLLVLLVGLGLARTAQAGGGFAIPEMGVRAAGMANAFTAIADDPSANWYNPAGIAFQERAIILGADLIMPKTSYEGGGGSYGMKQQSFFVPHHYGVFPLSGRFTLGFGINAPFGLSTDWTNSGAPFAQPAAGADSVTFSQVEGLQLNLNGAWRATDTLAVAAGVDYFDLRKVALDNALVAIHGQGHGWGGNLAVLWRSDTFALGASYRSRIRIKINGSARGLPGLGAGSGLVGVVGGASTTITLPDMLDVGAAWRLGPYTLSTTLGWMNWKTFDRIVIHFAPSSLNVATGTQKIVPENWKAVWDFRFGVNWHYDERYEARAGVVFQKTPVNSYDLSPRLPDADRFVFAIGLSRNWQASSLDFAYLFVRNVPRTISGDRVALYNGRYKTRVHLIAAAWRWRF